MDRRDDVFQVAELQSARREEWSPRGAGGEGQAHWSLTGCVKPGMCRLGQPPKYSAVISTLTAIREEILRTDENLLIDGGRHENDLGYELVLFCERWLTHLDMLITLQQLP